MTFSTIFDLIQTQAQRTPDRIAIQTLGKEPLSFLGLRNHIESITATLRNQGISRKDCIAIVLPNGAEMATACLAVAAGAICAPLNPEYRQEEFEFFLTDLEAKALIIQEGMASQARTVAEKLRIPIIELSSTHQPICGLFDLTGNAKQRCTVKESNSKPDDIALILHTSGTTSKPKMVPLTQHNICTTAANITRALSLTASDICLNAMPLFHIGGLVDLLVTPLLTGGSVICTQNFSAPHLTSYIKEYKPTWSQLVPTMLQDILYHFKDNPSTFTQEGSLRLIRSASAALPHALLQDFENTFDIPVIEIYGMTETAGLITSNPLSPLARKTNSVGLPSGPEVAIINQYGSFLPAQEKGEIVVRGNNVMGGYKNRPETNTDTFMDGWFRTGDIGYFDSDNYLFLTGRIKEIINRGGEKVSPQEVDEVLYSHPEVSDAATFSIPSLSLGEEVAAAVVLNEGSLLGKNELIKYLSTRLAYFKVPRNLFFIDGIPKTQNGKVQRNILSERFQALELQANTPKVNNEEPTSLLESMITTMWTKVLKVKNLGVDDNFFDMGGDSLKAATFINELQQKGGETVFVSAIFDAPSVSEFSQFLQDSHHRVGERLLGQLVTPKHSSIRKTLTPEKITQFRSAIAKTASYQEPAKHKNPRAVFLLSPPRSGSTLLRVMLAGNQQLFSPPELYMLSFNNLADRSSWFSGAQRGQLEGNIRGIMQLKDMEVEAAKSYMKELEQQNLTSQEYYRQLQEWAGSKLLVDKTPFYSVHPEILERAEMYFDKPLYIHLLRHPYGMIRSFEEVQLDQLWYPRLTGDEHAKKYPCPYESSEMGELVWLTIHQNISEFLKHIPQERQFRLKYEDLVSKPEHEMHSLCNFMGLDFDSGMLEPQQDKGKRMTDGLHKVSQMIGDMKFHQHQGITEGNANLWKTHYDHDFLCDETWALANSLGYTENIATANEREEFEF
jgi:acyl-CoA synthetase (AMP-forming)/AMP-acid ligase II/aryl carrier-like protein